MQKYLVGGAVRDELLGLPIKDHDWVVVGSTPSQLTEAGYKQVGADFPVFLHPKTKDEYALARTERKSGHGYAGFQVSFDASVTLEQDLERRDLTINAIAKDNEGLLIDPFDGQADVKNKLLRHVSPAFRDDPLRVLRIARFSARFHSLGFSIAPETQELLIQMSISGELEHLVAERVWTEMSRALGEQSPSEFFNTLKRSAALKVIFPELDKLFGVPQTMRWHPEVDTGIHTLKALDAARQVTDDINILLATLCHDLGKGLTPASILPSHRGHEKKGADLISQIAKKMKWPNKAAQLAENVARYHTHCHSISELKASTILELLKNLNAFRQPESVAQFALACESDFKGRSGFERYDYPQRRKIIECLTVCNQIQSQTFIVEGKMGKAIGEAMDRARISAIANLKADWG